jgi:uncharacterized membrane protein YoaK (UPF0700 family)
MPWREAVFNVVLCMLLFLGAFIGVLLAILFGDDHIKHLAIKVVILMVAVALAAAAHAHYKPS